MLRVRNIPAEGEILIFDIFFFSRGDHLCNTSRIDLATPTLDANI